MGLTLFPGDGDNSSPDVSWSCVRFHAFRELLARAEGFELDAMAGFGGERAWGEVATVLEPLLDHPDVCGDDLSPADCAAMLPRLEAIADGWPRDSTDPAFREHLEGARRLAVVLRLCVEKQVPLVFG